MSLEGTVVKWTTYRSLARERKWPHLLSPRLAEIPWADMRAMRNVVVHEYFGVTNETLWKTAREDLPAIVEPLRKLLAAP
jgi:uncharacterized protein with HEPN domain